MQKNLRWKLILIFAFLAVCTYYIVSPREKGAPLLSRLNLGLDLKGGIHLVLQVMTDEALNQELLQDGEAISRELRSKNIPFESSKKGAGYSVEVTGVDASRLNEARAFLESRFKHRYEIRSKGADGKTDFTLALLSSYVRETRESTVRQALETIRRRVDDLGVTEPTLQIYGRSDQEIEDQIIVELPGIDDPERVKSLIENTAQLELCLVKKTDGGPFPSIEAAVQANGGYISEDYRILPEAGDQGQVQYLVVSKIPVITGKDVKTARRGQDANGAPLVNFFLNAEGADRFGEATGRHIGENLAIVLDNVVKSAPVIRGKIEAEGVIEGRFSVQEAEDLALLLRSGALPASLKVLEERTVGASLGADSIRSGILASLIGFSIVVVGMLVYYRLSGLNAIWCLIANLLILLGFMSRMGATLTLPGIAGIILTIGMAVDANILIFERIREELRAGKTVRAAVDTGFTKVLWAILDSNITTLIAAACLFQFGTGPIRGFAVTLAVGLFANVFTATYFSHRMFELMLGQRKVETLSI